MLFPPRFAWQRYLACARVLLAVAGMIAFYRYMAVGSPFLLGALALFLAYSLRLLIRGPSRSGMLGLLALFVDAVYFLVLASYCVDGLLWLISIFFLYLLTEALAFYGPVEVVVIATVGIVACIALPNRAIHSVERAMVVAGALASGFAVNKRRQAAEIGAVAGASASDEEAHGRRSLLVLILVC